MGYIRFNITRTTDSKGVARYAKIGRIESDMHNTIESNIIWNALSKMGAVAMWLKMDSGFLNRDMLGDSDVLMLDRDMLNVDKLM